MSWWRVCFYKGHDGTNLQRTEDFSGTLNDAECWASDGMRLHDDYNSASIFEDGEEDEIHSQPLTMGCTAKYLRTGRFAFDAERNAGKWAQLMEEFPWGLDAEIDGGDVVEFINQIREASGQ